MSGYLEKIESSILLERTGELEESVSIVLFLTPDVPLHEMRQALNADSEPEMD